MEHRTFRAIKQINFDLHNVGEQRLLELHELEELRMNAYDSDSLYKAKTKAWHDANIVKKDFVEGHFQVSDLCSRGGFEIIFKGNQPGAIGGQEEGESMEESNHTVDSSIMEISNPNPPPTPIIIDISSDDEEDEKFIQVEQNPETPKPMEEEEDVRKD
ncbi:uncharacterized protein LOC110739889 [Chenopodium quinoa]|uniref:uncharacterized protein LOC110739889 n=1 Tax=Chenopodium quinoa TaxID=63459 RepID=UPI000B76EF57|nr:uncharacterized protein LOC110739889 [Chenopodium quinoa]